MVERLYQTKSEERAECPPLDWTGSFTVSRCSYNIGAKREAIAMREYGTVPHVNIRINYRVEMSAEQIRDLWKKLSQRLKRAGIVARVAIEITKNKRRTRPVNRVHYHLAAVCKDGQTPAELLKLVKQKCSRVLPVGSFRVTHKLIKNWKKKGVWYFVKYNKEDNYLFRSNTGLSKFYTINKELWWTDKEGVTRARKVIKDAMKRFAITKRLKESETFIPVLEAILDGIVQKFADKEHKVYVINRVDEWVRITRNSIHGNRDNIHGNRNYKGIPSILIDDVDSAISMLALFRNGLTDKDHRACLIDRVSEWVDKQRAGITPPQE